MKRKYSRSDPCSRSCFDRFLGRGGGRAVQTTYYERYREQLSAFSVVDVDNSRDKRGSPRGTEQDEQIAKEVNALSLEEQQQVHEDVHGVSKLVDETPDFLDARLRDMETEIRKVKRRAAYEKARFLSARYAQDRTFRLLFLRCDDYDARKAAYRFVCYFQFKLRLFGADKLVRDIAQADLDADDSEFLHRGYFQILPQPDRGGRMVVVGYSNNLISDAWQQSAKTSYYVLMELFRNESAQRLGVVGLSYECSSDSRYSPPLDTSLATISTQFYCSMPLKIRAFHFCYDNPKVAPLMTILKLSLGRRGRIRFRPHFGSDQECRYQLLSYGIPAQHIATTLGDDGGQGTRYQEWLQELAMREELESLSRTGDSDEDGLYPTEKDVVLGRGRPYQEHAGNRMLQRVLDDRYSEYMSRSRSEKSALFASILVEPKRNGTRFLEKTSLLPSSEGRGQTEWIEASDDKAKKKIGHGFRNKRALDRYRNEVEDEDETASSGTGS